MKYAKSIDEFFENTGQWNTILSRLRAILLETELDEKLKWGMPVYCLNNKNVAGLGGFNDFCGLWFYQGALLEDPAGILINAQEGKTKALRQVRLTKMEEVDELLLKSYIHEAIENQRKGKVIKPAKRKPLLIPEMLQTELDDKPELKEMFEQLNLTKKREFAEYIEMAKREATKANRLKKIIPMIMEGIGLNDKYR